tara:strand:+ start:1432 stop:1608 length:177 start_codon:yes stop_codon:yes gene_type:complete
VEKDAEGIKLKIQNIVTSINLKHPNILEKKIISVLKNVIVVVYYCLNIQIIPGIILKC